MLQIPSSQNKTSILDSMKLEQALRIAKKKSKEGCFEEVNKIYQDILENFPNNKKALQGIKALKEGRTKDINKTQNPTPEQMQTIFSLYDQGKYHQVLAQTNSILKLFPNSNFLYNIKGAANLALHQFQSAIEDCKQAIKINAKDAEVYYNMGIAFQNLADTGEAIKCYQNQA